MTISRFKPGKSGNPNGRPPGKTPGVQLRKAIAESMPEIINSLILQARNGDVQAAKVLLDRVCPTLKPQALPVTIDAGNTMTETGNNIIGATLTGSIPPDVGAMLIKALADQGKLTELDELTKRVEALEKVR